MAATNNRLDEVPDAFCFVMLSQLAKPQSIIVIAQLEIGCILPCITGSHRGTYVYEYTSADTDQREGCTAGF